jgi:hypothetical protein
MAAVKEELPDDGNESPRVLHPHFVVDAENNQTAVLLSIEDWNRVVEDLEELADIRSYERAKENPNEGIPLEQAMAGIRAEWEKTA